MSSNDATLTFLVDYLPEGFLQVAQKELNETPEKKVYLLRDLKILVKGDKTLNDIDIEPDFLIQFLRVSKFNVDVALHRLQKYINFRRKHPSFFSGVQEKISINSSYSWTSPLPFRSPDGCAMMVLKFGMWDTSDISYEHLQRLVHAILHQALRNPITQIKGFQVIMDFKDTTLRHLKYATPGNLCQVAQMYLECTPARFKQFHCVNPTLAMKIAWAVIAPFMSEKLRKRVMFHKHPEDLLKYFPKHTLPVEYGGQLEDYYMHTWIQESNYQMGLSTLSGQKNIF